MTNDITHTNSNALTSPNISPFKLYAMSLNSQLSPYPPARFVKGDYFGGPRKNEVEIPRFTEVVFAVDRTQIGWGRLERGSKPEFRLGYLNDPKAHHFRRAELGDLDQSQWPIGLNGKAEDVWKFYNFVPMILPSKMRSIFLARIHGVERTHAARFATCFPTKVKQNNQSANSTGNFRRAQIMRGIKSRFSSSSAGLIRDPIAARQKTKRG